MANQFVQVIIIICLLMGAYFVVERFSPDPLVTKLCQIAIFVIAMIVVVTKILPLVGIG